MNVKLCWIVFTLLHIMAISLMFFNRQRQWFLFVFLTTISITAYSVHCYTFNREVCGNFIHIISISINVIYTKFIHFMSDSQQNTRGREMFQMRFVSVRFDLGPPPRVAHAHTHRSETVPVWSVRSVVPTETTVETSPELVPQSNVRAATTAREDTRVPRVWTCIPAQR